MENKIDTVICLRIGKTFEAKTSPGDFKVTNPENTLLSQQAVTSKKNPSTLYQSTVEPLPQYPIGLVM